jgi:glycosyltransferase involved in cell wall biosynthesis
MLNRLFLSIKSQTDHNFIWLIVDDGSTDRTSEYVNSFMKDPDVDFKIVYIKKKNGGKHTAMKIGFERSQTKYMLEIDDDDELLPNSIEVIRKQWKKIEDEKRNDIAEIRALSINEKGIVSGNFQPPNDGSFYDSNYLTEDFYKNRHLENITSWRMDLIKLLNLFDLENEWLYERTKLVYETLFWNRIARVYNTRYINTPLRLYHSDANDSITRAKFTEQKCINYVFSLRIIIDELGKDRWKNIILYVKSLCIYMVCGFAAKVSWLDLISRQKCFDSKCLCFLISPIAFIYQFVIKAK